MNGEVAINDEKSKLIMLSINWFTNSVDVIRKMRRVNEIIRRRGCMAGLAIPFTLSFSSNVTLELR